jgi:trehalose synthase
VTCLWLMPFYPSPNRDDGYDISDYYGVDPRLGTLGDFVELVRTAADRGIRVILDLVVNHTSDKHPWFAAARSARDSPQRDWYVWRDEPAAEPASLAFPDKETSNWQRDRRSGQYYLHRFYRFMPDLNISNPAVRDEICKIAGFWLALGAAGFRIDAVPFLCELDGISAPIDGDPKGWLRSLRAFVGRRSGDAMLLGEVNASLQELASYFGDEDGDALHMEFAFMLNQSMWLALARENAEPLEQVISTLPKVPHDNAWATFLRNHDELSLDKLTVTQREEVFAAFAPDEEMRMYGHGIRRRTAPMLGGDGPRLRMAWSVLLSLPGTPVILYGDEVGLTEDLSLEGRLASRVPMDWAAVAGQAEDRGSLLAHMRHLIRARRQAPEFGWGASTLLENEPPALFAHRCEWEGSAVIAAHNLSPDPVEAEVDAGDDIAGARDLLGDHDHEARDGRLAIRLDGYGFVWLRLRRG